MRRYFLDSLAGRAIVVGIALRVVIAIVGALAGPVPRFLAIVDSVAGFAIAAGAAFFLFKLIVIAKRRLLWRVRRKLILSYVFVGFVPALLIVGFFLLCGYLLFYNFSSYLVQSRLRSLSDQARFLAQTTALEIQRSGARDVPRTLARRQAAGADQFPGLSIALVPIDRACEGITVETSTPASAPSPQRAGPWEHTDAPDYVPDWVGCEGFAGVLAYAHPASDTSNDAHVHLLVRAVGLPESAHPAYAVVVDILVNDSVRGRLRRETGVDIRSIEVGDDVTPLDGRGRVNDLPATTPAPGGVSRLLPPSAVDYRQWESGDADHPSVFMALSIGELYDKISGAQTPGRVTV